MYFIAHVEIWDAEKNDFVENKILFFANNYPDATQAIVNFCGDTLERITLLEKVQAYRQKTEDIPDDRAEYNSGHSE